MRSPPQQPGQSSPSSLAGPAQLSQTTLNPLTAPKPQQKRPSHPKKRLKFDSILQQNLADGSNHFPQGDTPSSQQQIQLEFHIGNCLKCLADFFKTDTFRYIYVTVLMLFLINCTLEAAQISDQVRMITEEIDLGMQIFFSLCLLVKLTQIQNQHFFWIFIDVMTNLSAYLAFSLSSYPQPARYLKAVKILRLLMIVKESNYLQVPAAKLLYSLSSVGKILFPAALFIYFYAIIGLYSFRDYEYSKCRDPANKFLTANWTVYSESVFLCGEKSCPIINGVQLQCLNPIDFGVEPTYSQVENMIQGNGLMKYNNIFYSLFSTFKQTFITGSSRLMILGKQATNYFYVLIYYLSFIYLLAYIYLNIFYGLMITNEEEAQENSNRRESSFQLKLQRRSSKKKTMEQFKEKAEEVLEETDKPLVVGRRTTVETMNESEIPPRPNLQRTFSKQLDNINEIQESEKSDFDQVIDFTPNIASAQNNRPHNQKDHNKNHPQTSHSQTDQQTLLSYGQIMKKYFLINHIVVVLCSINILIDYEGQTHTVKLIVDAIDFAFFWVYMVEMLFRVGVHLRYIPKEPFDKAFKLDLFLFCLCTCGLAYQVATAQNLQHFLMASDNASRLLRTLKYLRIFILISSTPYFNQARIIFNSTLQAVYSVRSLSTLWLLILLTFSIMGYHMFQGKVKVNHSEQLDLVEGHPQAVAFQGIVDSFIYTVFIFFNQEWDWFLFQQYISQEVLIVIWQLIVLVVGLQVLSKYFMALLMKELGDKLNEEDELAEEDESEFLEQEEEIENMIENQQSEIINNNNSKLISQSLRHNSSHMVLKLKAKEVTSKEQPQAKRPSHQRQRRISINSATGGLEVKNFAAPSNSTKRKTRRESKMRDLILRENQPEQPNRFFKLNNINSVKPSARVSNQAIDGTVQQLGLLTETSTLLFHLLKSRCFIFIKVLIILISIACTLTMNPQEDPNSSKTQIFTKIWYSTVAFFGLQIILSMFACGIITPKTGYLRNGMNWIYLFVFVIQILAIIPHLAATAHLESLLSFRILRIFVFIELKYQADADMRLTMVAFWKLLPKVINLLAITIIMYGFFAIILVKLYKDDFYYCDGYESQATIKTQTDCLNWGGSWIQRRMNVSNIFNSLLYLFLLATTEGWSTQVIEAASLRGAGNQPEYGHNVWMEYFFSAFFFLGNMIMLNVFIGLSVYNFQKIKSQVTGLTRLSKDDKMWFSIKNTIYRLSPKMKNTPPQNPISEKVHAFMKSKAYKIITTILLVLFLLNMSFYETNMSDSKEKVLDAILDGFIGVFVLEYLLLWIGNGLRAVKQRIFWFSTVATVYYVILLTVVNTMHVQPKLYRMLYGVAICLISIRCFAILNEIDFVKKMINSLVSIFPQTSNIWLLIFIVLFTYAVIGIYFFSYLKISPELNEFDQNYTNLPSAVYALIKFSTLQSPILQIMDSTARIQPNSVCFDIYSYQDFEKHGRMGCGNPVAGYIFFLSFQLIYTMILLSTLLAIIVDAYSQVRREQQSMVNKFQLEEVQKQWQNYDPEATGYISYRDFWMFTAKLVKIYKVNKQELLSHDTKQSFLKSLQIPIYEDDNGVLSFQFHEVVQALTRIVVKQKMGPDWNTKQADKVFKNHSRTSSSIKVFKKSVYDSSHVLTLIILKSGLKAWKRKTINVENHQNFQNLLSIAKKEKEKNDSNAESQHQFAQMNQAPKPTGSQLQRSNTIVSSTSKPQLQKPPKLVSKPSLGASYPSNPSNFQPSKSPREPISIERNQNNLIINKKSSMVKEEDHEADIEEIK